MQYLIKMMKALSDETRLRLLNLLLEKECCVCEAMQALDISQTRASRNLKVLHDTGLLKQRKDGLWSLYSLDKEGTGKDYHQLVGVIEKALANNPAAIMDIERLRKAKRVGPSHAQKKQG